MSITPEETPLTAPYWEAARRGVVLLQRCAECSVHWHPPQPTCPDCVGEAWEWIPSEGKGVVHSFTVVHHVVHGAVADAVPYVVSLVELAEGPLLICNILGVAPADVAVGLRVELRLGDTPGGERLVQAFPS